MEQQQQACLDASAAADSRANGRYQMPLLAWDNEWTRYTAYIAWFYLMNTVGFAPQAGSDVQITRNKNEAIGGVDPISGVRVLGFFEGVQRQSIHPNVTPSTPLPGDAVHDVPQVFTAPVRGWTCRTGRQAVG